MLSVIQTIDETILMWIQNNIQFAMLNPIVEFFTSLGNAGVIWISISLLMLCFKKTRKIGIVTGIALLFSLIITNLGLKLFFERPRPYVTMGELAPLVISSDPNSFPSGHTSAAFAAGIVWAKMLPNGWMRITAVIQAVFMGLSRLYVCVHYPSDVLVGAIVGIVCAILALKVKKYFKYTTE